MVAGVPSVVWYTAGGLVLKVLIPATLGGAADGEGASDPSPRSLKAVFSAAIRPVLRPSRSNGKAHLSESLVVEAVWVFFRLGWGILHSIWKATQLVHGMPKEAASHLTFRLFTHDCQPTETEVRKARVMVLRYCNFSHSRTGKVVGFGDGIDVRMAGLRRRHYS